ncbi:MAG: hypothetical protein ACYDG2_13300 [Ruminiclostridium sp.]
MFGKSKVANFNYIMAIKDYTKTLEAIENGSFYVPFSKEIYIKLLKNQAAKVDNVKELGKFINTSKKDKKEVAHFWEGLIASGYTLVGVQYDEKTPSFERLCNNTTIKFVCTV